MNFANVQNWQTNRFAFRLLSVVVRGSNSKWNLKGRVDIRSAFLGHGIYCRQFWNKHYRSTDPTYWYWDNFEDPNNRGYDAIRRLFLNEIASAVPARLANWTPATLEQ